ncbi:MAG TPA: hypothetical protein VGH99_03830 [Pseudonocardia sp.]
MLLGLLGVGAAGPAAALLSGCGSGEPDPLVALIKRARRDAALVDAILATRPVGAALAGRLGPVAEARRQHAGALTAVLGDSAPSPKETAPAADTNPPSEDTDGALSRVRAALDEGRKQAAALVLSVPRAQAGLVGSIAACCGAYRALLE